MAAEKKKGPVLAGTGRLSKPIYEFTHLTTLEGEPLDASKLRGKVVLVTNVSSKCGYTKLNYEGLNKLHEEFGRDLAIVGVPCNQFGEQEPGTPAEIREFVRSNFDSKFTLTSKCDVNGPRTHPLYVELKRATGTADVDIRWNFEAKFVVAKDGVSVARYNKAFDPAHVREYVAAAATGARL